jgi:hypothetical protein
LLRSGLHRYCDELVIGREVEQSKSRQEDAEGTEKKRHHCHGTKVTFCQSAGKIVRIDCEVPITYGVANTFGLLRSFRYRCFVRNLTWGQGFANQTDGRGGLAGRNFGILRNQMKLGIEAIEEERSKKTV